MSESQIIPKTPETSLVGQLVIAANKKTGAIESGEPKFYQSGESYMLVEPSPSATQDDIIAVIETFAAYSSRLQHHRALTNWNIARLILSLSAMLGKDYTEVVIDYGIHDRTGVKVKTLLNWLAVAQKLPEDLMNLKLDWSCYVKAAEVMIPQEPQKAIEHVQRVRQILTDAAKDPVEKNSAWVAIEMREIKKDNAPPGLYDDLTVKDRLVDLVNLLRILRLVDGGADIDDTKLQSRTDLITAIEECESWVIKRKLISADALSYEPHCIKSKRLREEAKNAKNINVVDVEIVES